MAHTKTVTLAVLVVALLAALTLAVGCSSGGGSAAAPQKTLETYIKAHQSEWDNTVAQIKESGGSIMDVEMTCSGNTITQIMTYKQVFPDDAVAQMKQKFEEQGPSMVAKVADQIKQMEQEADVTGITWIFEYRNGDGKAIYSTEAKAAK